MWAGLGLGVGVGVGLAWAGLGVAGSGLAGSVVGRLPNHPTPPRLPHPAPRPQIGLGLLRADAGALKCWNSIHDAIWHAELGSSAAILRGGYNIDSLLLRYQGIDWRDTANWGCNGE